MYVCVDAISTVFEYVFHFKDGVHINILIRTQNAGAFYVNDKNWHGDSVIHLPRYRGDVVCKTPPIKSSIRLHDIYLFVSDGVSRTQ